MSTIHTEKGVLSRVALSGFILWKVGKEVYHIPKRRTQIKIIYLKPFDKNNNKKVPPSPLSFGFLGANFEEEKNGTQIYIKSKWVYPYQQIFNKPICDSVCFSLKEGVHYFTPLLKDQHST